MMYDEVTMKKLMLTKIRLSWYFIGFLSLYLWLSFTVPTYEFVGGVLTLFSVNSFLYGFYISPVLAAQKARIEELHRIVRTEANTIFSMMMSTKKLPKSLRNQFQSEVSEYLDTCAKGKLKKAEKEYEDLISFCVEYKGSQKEEVDKLLEKLIANQQNRTMLNMQMGNKVFSNEWLIMGVLFSITLVFVLLIDIGSSEMIAVVKALLCTGLSMLMLILVKLSTLTHKKAKEIWKPFTMLLSTRYYRIVDDVEFES